MELLKNDSTGYYDLYIGDILVCSFETEGKAHFFGDWFAEKLGRPTSIESSAELYGLNHALENAERRVLKHALKLAKGNQARAARLLQINRTTFICKAKRLGLDPAELLR